MTIYLVIGNSVEAFLWDGLLMPHCHLATVSICHDYPVSISNDAPLSPHVWTVSMSHIATVSYNMMPLGVSQVPAPMSQSWFHRQSQAVIRGERAVKRFTEPIAWGDRLSVHISRNGPIGRGKNELLG